VAILRAPGSRLASCISTVREVGMELGQSSKGVTDRPLKTNEPGRSRGPSGFSLFGDEIMWLLTQELVPSQENSQLCI
jgi:hypothetical protein